MADSLYFGSDSLPGMRVVLKQVANRETIAKANARAESCEPDDWVWEESGTTIFGIPPRPGMSNTISPNNTIQALMTSRENKGGPSGSNPKPDRSLLVVGQNNDLVYSYFAGYYGLPSHYLDTLTFLNEPPASGLKPEGLMVINPNLPMVEGLRGGPIDTSFVVRQLVFSKTYGLVRYRYSYSDTLHRSHTIQLKRVL